MRYTPMTEEVRGDYAHFQCPVGVPDCTDPYVAALAEFDRWLAALIREAKAEAWDEAEGEIHKWYSTYKATLFTAPENPYREGSET